jgi:hypothetical protein
VPRALWQLVDDKGRKQGKTLWTDDPRLGLAIGLIAWNILLNAIVGLGVIA